MPEVQIYNLDDIDTIVTNLTEGEYVFGRGPLLKCEDRRVSRNHAALKIQQDSITITSIHQNPCFFQSSDSTTITILPKDSPIHVNDGDKFALLADKFWFKVRVVSTTRALSHHHNGSPIMAEASSSKRKTEDEANSSAKRSKLKNDQRFSFSESSNDSVDFLKLDQNCVKNSDVVESTKVLSKSGDGDNSDDSIDFLKLGDTINDEPPNEENNSGYINVESCSTNNSIVSSSINNKNEDGEGNNMKSTDGAHTSTSTDVLKMDTDRLQALEDVLSDLININKTSKINNEASTDDTVSTTIFKTEVKNASPIKPKTEVLSDLEDEKDTIDVLAINTASGSGGAVPKREVMSDSENESKPIKIEKTKKITKKKGEANQAHRAKLMAMLDSSDEDEVGVEVDEIPAIQTNEVDDCQETNNIDKKQSIDTNCATTSGTNDRILRERCWYGPSCFRKNADHLRQLSHPGDSDYETDPDDERPMCVYGGTCYRRNPDHRKEYRHPKAKNDNNATKKTPVNKKRAPAKKYNESSEDDYDLQDPFIGDSGSEFDADSVSEDTTDTDFSDGAEEETKRLVKESKRFLKKNKKDD